MPRLYLLRHAKSSWDDPRLDDRDRPLAPRGGRAAKLIRGHLREEGIEPELVLCSPARRARETLAGISPALGNTSDIRFDEALYTFSVGELLAAIRTANDAVGSVMVIGHNPAIQELALSVARGGAEREAVARKFPTGALATLELDHGWSSLASQSGELVGFVRPKDLRRGG